MQPGTQSQSQVVQGPQKKHITFNPYVEQCIALEVPKVKTRNTDPYSHGYSGYSGDGGYSGYSGFGGYAGGSSPPTGTASANMNGNDNVLFDDDGVEVEHKEERLYEFEDEDENVEDANVAFESVESAINGSVSGFSSVEHVSTNEIF